MSIPMFSWLFGDPAKCVDRRRDLEARVIEAEQRQAERKRLRKARRIKQLVALAKAGKLRGQKR